MNKRLACTSMLCLAIASLSAQWGLERNAPPATKDEFVKVFTFKDIPYSQFAIWDGPGGTPIDPIIDGAGNWVFVKADEIAIYSPSFKLIGKVNAFFNHYASQGTSGYIIGQRLFGVMDYDHIYINRYDDTVCDMSFPVDTDYTPIMAYANIVILRNAATSKYLGYRIEKNGAYTIMENDDLIEYLISLPGKRFDRGLKSDFIFLWSYANDTLAFANTQLKFPVKNIDEENIIYGTMGMYAFGDKRYYDVYDGNGKRRLCQVDNQGNYWLLEYPENPADGIAVYYRGKNWQTTFSYGRNGPEYYEYIGTALEDGACLIITPESGGIPLATIAKGHRVGILQKGPLATVSGKEGNWYKVETLDGLVGWVFGPSFTIVNVPPVED